MIGDICPKNPFHLAPMAGITDSAYRTICSQMGVGMTTTEMVSAKALAYGDKKSATLLEILPQHRPCAVQIFGSEPDFMASGAQIALEKSGADIIDINMGCPVPKIVSNGDGSALMRNVSLASQVISAVKNAVSVPVTVKFRRGWDSENINAVEFAKMAQDSGAAAICVHGRTRCQMYTGTSDRQIIAHVKRAVTIPVTASGDAFSPQACIDIMAQTGADYVAIARGALGNPWIFRQCLELWQGLPITRPSLTDFIEIMTAHVSLTCLQKGEGRAMAEVRKHMLWYLDKLKGSKPIKVKMAQIRTMDDFKTLCRQILEEELQVKP